MNVSRSHTSPPCLGAARLVQERRRRSGPCGRAGRSAGAFQRGGGPPAVNKVAHIHHRRSCVLLRGHTIHHFPL